MHASPLTSFQMTFHTVKLSDHIKLTILTGEIDDITFRIIHYLLMQFVYLTIYFIYYVIHMSLQFSFISLA